VGRIRIRNHELVPRTMTIVSRLSGVLEWTLVRESQGTEARVLLSGQAGQSVGKLGRLGLPPRTLSCGWRVPRTEKGPRGAARVQNSFSNLAFPVHRIALHNKHYRFVFLTPP